MYLPTTQQRMTADEFAALPVGPPYSQLIEGELHLMASPNRLHQEIVGNLHFSVKLHLRASPGLGKVYMAPSDVKLDEANVFEPDLYFVSLERISILTKQGVAGAPDFVVEVLSPSTLRLDREKKRAVYFRAGVREVWFVLPDRQQVEIHLPETRGEDARRLKVGDLLNTPLLPGWSLEVGELFG